MKILVIWRLLTVGGVNAGWRNRAVYFKKYGIETDFLYSKDLGGMHMIQDVARVFLTNDKKKIKRILTQNHYDVVIVVDTSKAYTWLKEADYKGPVIIEARTPELTKLSRNLSGSEQIAPTCYIVPSYYQKRVLSTLIDPDTDIQVIYNGLDTSFFKPHKLPDSGADHPSNGKKIIAYIGRLDVRKNWRLMLQIAKVISKERKDLEFWVIGGAKSIDRESFASELKRLGIEGTVKWHPVIPYHEMPMIYTKIRESGGCTLATTLSESFGNTFIESMACGVPAVAPEVASIPEIVVHGKTGYLYRENHVRGAINMIYKVVDEEENYSRLSKDSIERVLENFQISHCAERYIELLKEVKRADER